MIPVLFIDDNKELCTLFKFYLEETGEFSVHFCHDGQEALLYLEDHEVMAVISDYDMPEMNGIDLLTRIRSVYPRLPFIMLTGNDNKETVIAALNAGADFYQNKGADFEVQVLDLSHKIRILSGRHQAQEAARRSERILAAISYATERLLKGTGSWQEDMGEILGRLGMATRADSVFVAAVSPDGEIPPAEPVVWTAGPDHTFPYHSDPVFYSRLLSGDTARDLSENRELTFHPGTYPAGIRDMVREEDGSILLLVPVFLNDKWWGTLGISSSRQGWICSDEEMHALRVAAGVIGSSRYRRYIEEFFKNPVEEALVGVFLLRDSSFLYVNPRFCEIFGYPRDVMLSGIYPQNLIHPDNRDEVIRNVTAVRNREIAAGHYEIAGLTIDGRKIFLELYVTLISCDGLDCLIGNVMDVTERYYARKALAESEKRFRELYTGINDMVLLHLLPQEGGHIIEVNQSAYDTLLVAHGHISTRTLADLCPAGHEREICEEHCKKAASGKSSACQTIFERSDGYLVPVDLSTHRVTMRGREILLTVARNETERREAEARIRAGEELLRRNMLLSLKEKETLLREIHHRVKNNMQIIISLLKLQDYQSDDSAVHEIIRDCRNRIYSMAVIHEKLYQTSELSSIRLSEYIRDIAGRVIAEFDGDLVRISLMVDENQPVLVDIGTGIPLGLIINELVTNSMKYAFSADEKGEIVIRIRHDRDTLVISVTDSGPGLPEEFNGETADTLGTELIRSLVFQLRGTAEWSGGSGTTCMITIPHHLMVPVEES